MEFPVKAFCTSLSTANLKWIISTTINHRSLLLLSMQVRHIRWKVLNATSWIHIALARGSMLWFWDPTHLSTINGSTFQLPGSVISEGTVAIEEDEGHYHFIYW